MIFKIGDIVMMQREAERFCTFLADNEVPENRVFDSRLVFNELVGNILKHARGVATVYSEIKDGYVEVRVQSTKVFIPPQTTRLVDVHEEHGRGLFLVDSVCEERTTAPDGTILVKISTTK